MRRHMGFVCRGAVEAELHLLSHSPQKWVLMFLFSQGGNPPKTSGCGPQGLAGESWKTHGSSACDRELEWSQAGTRSKTRNLDGFLCHESWPRHSHRARGNPWHFEKKRRDLTTNSLRRKASRPTPLVKTASLQAFALLRLRRKTAPRETRRGRSACGRLGGLRRSRSRL